MSRPTHTLRSSTVISPAIGAVAGMLSAAVLSIGILKLSGVIPAVPVVQLIAPTGQAFALLFVIGLAGTALRSSTWMQLATALNVLGLALGVGVEYLLNFVLREVSDGVLADLLAGTAGTALALTSVVFLLGSLAFAAALWVTGTAPKALVAGYALGATVVGIRSAVPTPVFLVGLGILALSMLALSVWMIRRAGIAD